MAEHTSGKNIPKFKGNERLLVQGAIPKIAGALHSIVTKTKDKDFQERCKQKTQVRGQKELLKKIEDKLWEIASYRLGIGSCLDKDEINDQVVPQNHQIIIDNLPKEQAVKKQEHNSSLNTFSDLSSFDNDYCINPDSSFYKQEDQENENTLKLPQTEQHSNIHHSLQNKRHSKDDEDDWLSLFAQDSYWVDKTLDTTLVKSFSAKEEKDRLIVNHINEAGNGLSCLNNNCLVNMSDRENTSIDSKVEETCPSPASKETICINGYRMSSPKGPLIKNMNCDIQPAHTAIKRTTTNHSITKEIPDEYRLSLQDNFIDDFDALEDFFNDSDDRTILS